MKELNRDIRLTERVDASNVWTFETIAIITTQRQIRWLASTSMLLRDDVIYLEWQPGAINGEVTILTPIAGAFLN
jgi:hypothetical protein